MDLEVGVTVLPSVLGLWSIVFLFIRSFSDTVLDGGQKKQSLSFVIISVLSDLSYFRKIEKQGVCRQWVVIEK